MLTTIKSDKKYNVIWLGNTDSTSSELKRNVDIYGDGTVISAEYQTEGKGQFSRVWHSEYGQNLLFSILLKYDSLHVLRAADQQILSKACSLAATDFLKEHGIECRIKKPNDIYADNGKICGMLIENGVSGELMRWSVIGMGINVNQTVFPSWIPNPASMSRMTGEIYDIRKCLEEFLGIFSGRIESIWSSASALEEDYAGRLLISSN